MQERDDSIIAIAYTLLLCIAALPRLECFAFVVDRCKCRYLIFKWQNCGLKVKRCISPQFVILLKIQPFSLLLAIFIEYVANACFMTVLTVAIQVKEVLCSLGSTEQVFLRQEIKHLPTFVGVTCHTATQQYTEATLSILDEWYKS